MAATESLWEFEQVTPDAGPVGKEAGAARAAAKGSVPNGKSPNGPSLNGAAPAPNRAAPNGVGTGKSPEAILINGRIRDVVERERGIAVRIDRRRDDPLTEFGKFTLSDRYLMNRRFLGGSQGAARG